MNFLRAARFPTPYNFEVVSSLNVLRYKKFATKVVTSKEVIQSHTLPPTIEAAVYHDLRVYYQVQIWIGGLELDVCEFG
jgi:hypothetical protein